MVDDDGAYAYVAAAGEVRGNGCQCEGVGAAAAGDQEQGQVCGVRGGGGAGASGGFDASSAEELFEGGGKVAAGSADGGVQASCAGMLEGRTFKAVFTGGPSNTLLTVKDLDVPLDFVSVRERKSSLGTGAMIVISEGTSVVRKVAEYVEFFASNSCGQCPPCKGGTFQLSRLLNRVDTGIGTSDDLRALQSLCQLLPRSGRCGLIDGAVTVLQSSLRTFPEEYGLPAEQD